MACVFVMLDMEVSTAAVTYRLHQNVDLEVYLEEKM